MDLRDINSVMLEMLREGDPSSKITILNAFLPSNELVDNLYAEFERYLRANPEEYRRKNPEVPDSIDLVTSYREGILENSYYDTLREARIENLSEFLENYLIRTIDESSRTGGKIYISNLGLRDNFFGPEVVEKPDQLNTGDLLKDFSRELLEFVKGYDYVVFMQGEYFAKLKYKPLDFLEVFDMHLDGIPLEFSEVSTRVEMRRAETL